MNSKFKPSENFGSDMLKRLKAERNWRESQRTMARLGEIQLNCNDRWEGWVEFWRICNGFAAIWLAVFSMTWYKYTYVYKLATFKRTLIGQTEFIITPQCTQPTSHACIIYQHMHATYVNSDLVPCEIWQNFTAKCLAASSTPTQYIWCR